MSEGIGQQPVSRGLKPDTRNAETLNLEPLNPEPETLSDLIKFQGLIGELLIGFI
jgi:hypothetical protein